MASPVGLQQILRTQGIQWGDSGRSGLGDFHFWFDGGGNLVTDAVWAPQGGMNATAPDGVSSGVAGKGFAFTTGAGTVGNANGGSFAINLGDGSGTGTIGQVVITSTPTGTPTGTPGLATAIVLNQTANASGATSVAYMGQWNHTYITGAGANYTSTFHSAAEFYGYNQTTGNLNAVIYGAEGSSVQDGTGTLLKMVGIQGNVITGSTVGAPGVVTTAAGVVSDSQLTKGVTTNLYFFQTAQAALGTSTAAQVVGIDLSIVVNDSAVSAGNSTVGGYVNYGLRHTRSTQSGNTSGTNTLYSIFVTGDSGTPGAGGTVNSYGINIAANTSAVNTSAGIFVGALGSVAGSSGGMNNRAGWFTIPNAGGNSSGTVSNIAVYATSNSGGTGTSTTGGSVNNIAALLEVPSAVAASGGGTTNNFGLQITGNGNGGSTGANQAIRCTSTAGGVLNGPWSLGSSTSPVSGVIGITGNVTVTGLITNYNSIATNGNGVGSIVKYTRPAQQVNATVTLVTYTTPAADGSYRIWCNVNVTVSTTVTMTVTCAYTDEANVARTLTIPFFILAGTLVASITTAQGNISYESVPITIRTKASTSITIATAGTVTAVTYTGEGFIEQVA